MTQQNFYKTCPKCDKPGIEKPAEILPDKGMLIQVMHDDGRVCDFVEYPIDFFLNRQKKKRDPKTIDCPACGEKGRVGWYRPKKEKQFHTWKYFVVHEQIEGYWGKNHNNKKKRRCYLKTDAQRNEVLRSLGRYAS